MKQPPFLYIFLTYKQVYGLIEPFIMGGEYTNIEEYPYSVYLSIDCGTSFVCGGSILNQVMVLTAAHCLEECSRRRSNSVIINYGHEEQRLMESTRMERFMIHESYEEITVQYDICLLTSTKPIKLGSNAKRVAIMPNPPSAIFGEVAGWGVINENYDTTTSLKHTSQKIQPPQICKERMGSIPMGAFCAGPIKGVGNPHQGDSGSALVIKSYIQIGIVSYKVTDYSLVMYTNVSHYYDWITKQAKNVYCG